MGSITRAAALAAAAFVGLQTADAGFIYSTSSRSVSAVAGTTDNKSTSAFGNWFGSAFAAGGTISALSNQGSDLQASVISLVGAGQATGAVGAIASGSSVVDTTFVAVSDDGSAVFDVSWIIGLSQNTAGVGASSVFIKLTDVTTGTVRLMLSNNTTASGNLSVVSGRTYRLEASAVTSVQGSGNAFGSFNANFSIVPAPGALALAGVAGAVGGRARRRR